LAITKEAADFSQAEKKANSIANCSLDSLANSESI
jgi:hypothetical protein